MTDNNAVNVNPTSSLAYLLGRHAQDQTQFILTQWPTAYPAQVVQINGNMIDVNISVSGINGLNAPITVPIATSRYLRLPLQEGDWGLLVPSNYSIQNAIGNQKKTPSIDTIAPNMSALVFLPFSRVSKNITNPNDKMVWPEVDPDTLLLSGEKNGVQIQNAYDGPSNIALKKDEIDLIVKEKKDNEKSSSQTQGSVTIKKDAIDLKVGKSTAHVEDGKITLQNGNTSAIIKDGEINFMDGVLKITPEGVIIRKMLTIGETEFMKHTHSNGNLGAPTGAVIPS